MDPLILGSRAWTALIVALALGACTGLPSSSPGGQGSVLVAPSWSTLPSVAPPSATDAGPRSRWIATGSMLIPRSDHTATLLADGRVLVAGGDGDSAELFDPVTGSWAHTGSMSSRRAFGHTATLLPDGKVLVAGGSEGDGAQPMATAELYDPQRGSWAPTGSMLQAHSGHTATLLADGRVLVTGGSGWSQFMGASELYDPTSGTWAATGNLIDPRTYHSASLLSDGRVLVAGGIGDGGCCGVALAAVELFEPSTGTWTAAESMTEARYRHTATMLADGRLLVAGGQDEGVQIRATAEIFEAGRDSWTPAESMDRRRSSHTATLLSDGTVLLVGGVGQHHQADLWNPSTGHWVVAGSTATTRGESLTATLLADGRVLVTGGDIVGDSAELFYPSGAT